MKKLIAILCPVLLLIACERAPEEIAVTSVTITQPTAEMIVGETVQLQVSITPTNATDKTTLWSSSKQSVATVNNEGLVTAVGAGNTTITAVAGGKFGTCLVAVSKGFVAVTSVSLNTAKITLVEVETTTLTATVLPEDATDKSVAWTSSAGDVATVKDGLVTALKAGTCTITAKAGEKTAQCTVEVKPKVIAVTEVSLSKYKLSLAEGDAETLVATVKPDNATDKSVSWSSSNDAIATVTSSGKVTAVMEGTAVITASAGGKHAMCVVEVSKKVIPVTLISLNKSSLTLERGKTEMLVATVNPTNATDNTVTWSSSNPQVASVNQNGLVIAVNSGGAVIIATAGDKTATCNVTVKVPIERVVLDKTSITLIKGQEATLIATIYPADATDKTITWTSSNASVATVSDGIVKAMGAGTATITAQAGNMVATCLVNVNVPVSSVAISQTSITLDQGENHQLTVTISPVDATDKSVSWSSNNTGVASVTADGMVSALNIGTATITVRTTDGGYEASCYVTVVADPHPSVDLGLSVKWSTFNYGASTETAKGGYYLYGDPYGTGVPLYFDPPTVSSISGTQYDIVRQNWGGKWRIPTRAEVAELYNICSWQSTTINGISVFRVTGPNGNSIIMPQTGYTMPDDGPVGTTTIIDSNSVYTMTGSADTSGGVFVYVYIRKSNGEKSLVAFNAAFALFPIRPVK